MSECSVKFQSPACKRTINYLVIEYLKYILYYRGQFPLPLDQLKRTVLTAESKEPPKIGNQVIFSDDVQPRMLPKPNILKEKTRRGFIDSIKKFDDFFNQLNAILQDEEVLEIVMNLGPNMMSPKELHRITLPQPSSELPQCTSDPKSLQRYRVEFFKAIMHSAILQDSNLDNPSPISVLLKLKAGGTLKDCMEQKRFYAPPTRCRQVRVEFDSPPEVLSELEHFQDLSIGKNTVTQPRTDLWVKLKSELKGFKDFVEAQNTLSNSNFF